MLEMPRMNPIDPEMLLFGSIHIEWSDCHVPTYYVYRDTEPIISVDGYIPYAIIEGKTNFDDTQFESGRTYYYTVVAVQGQGRSKVSNSEKIKILIPQHINLDQKLIAEEAYFESQRSKRYDEKVWQLARLQLILAASFPGRHLDYLKLKVKSIKRDLPEFKGLLQEPTESEIRKRAQWISEEKPNSMDLDWKISELSLILQKIQELLEFEVKTR